jgi:hypothetical protein
MQPFNTLSKEALLDALTEYYNRYRTLVEFDADDREFARCSLTLEAIIKELNSRLDEKDSIGRGGFDFTRFD